jgi:hypothetical protein
MPGGAFPHRGTCAPVEGGFYPNERVRSQDPLLGEMAHGRNPYLAVMAFSVGLWLPQVTVGLFSYEEEVLG